DAASSALVPRIWTRRFSLRSLVLVPLVAAGEPCGLMVVDYRTPRRFPADEVRLLEAIGASAGVAVRNARLFEETRAAAVERARLLTQRDLHLRQLRVLYGLRASLAKGLNADLLADRLNELLGDERVRVTRIAFRGRGAGRP